jgi:hypothetical protein
MSYCKNRDKEDIGMDQKLLESIMLDVPCHIRFGDEGL